MKNNFSKSKTPHTDQDWVNKPEKDSILDEIEIYNQNLEIAKKLYFNLL